MTLNMEPDNRKPALNTQFETNSSLMISERAFILALDTYEGPMDALLDLACRQKIDLLQIKICDLADQYLAFVDKAKKLNLELATEYLVMAAWLAYLKSRLLLPMDAEPDEELDAGVMAERLAFQLYRLDAMRQAARDLLKCPKLGIDVFTRGAPEGVRTLKKSTYNVDIIDILKAYAWQRRKKEIKAPIRVQTRERYSIDDALVRLRSVIGDVSDWTALVDFIPREEKDITLFREVVSTTFVATLELARHGEIQLRQGAPYAQIYFKYGKETAKI